MRSHQDKKRTPLPVGLTSSSTPHRLLAQPLEHAGDVCRAPVDPRAGTAAGEAALRPEYIGGNTVAHRFTRDDAGRAVATDAAPEQPIHADRETAFAEDLADLALEILAADQDMVTGRTAQHQSAVTREDRPPLPRGAGDEGTIFDLRLLTDVVPENDQPLGQGSQHAIGKEPHSSPGRAGGCSGAGHV